MDRSSAKPSLRLISNKISEREHTRRAIHASRLRRLLPRLAARLGLDESCAFEVAERTFFLCATCLGPMPSPRVYLVDGQLRGFLCGRCEAAIEACDADLERLRHHWRFTPERAVNRHRLARFIDLHSLPAEASRDLPEEQVAGRECEAGYDAHG